MRVFAPLEQLEHFEKHANDRLRRIIAWLLASRFSLCLLVWPGSLLLPILRKARSATRSGRADTKRYAERSRYTVCYPEGWEEQSAHESSSSPACDGNA